VSWFQPEIATLRYSLDADHVTALLERRRHWEKHKLGYSLIPTVVAGVTRDMEKKVHDVRQWLANNKHQIKTVFCSDAITVYVNDPAVVNQLVVLGKTVTDDSVYVREVLVTLPPNVVCLKRPYDYSFRSYFKAQHLSDNSIAVLNNWIENMGDGIRACPSLKQYLQGKHRSWWAAKNWTWNHYFVDHNDPKLEVWMSMMCPGIVRKTLSIVSAAK
jgi:hypothetical protein